MRPAIVSIARQTALLSHQPCLRRKSTRPAINGFHAKPSKWSNEAKPVVDDSSSSASKRPDGKLPVLNTAPVHSTTPKSDGPAAEATTRAQAYEAKQGNIGFNIHDGPVPINETARGKRKKRRKPDSDSSNSSSSSQSLIDPHYVPLENQTHLIQGGTPCDIASATTPPFSLAQYGETSVYTLILLRHGESEWNSQNRYTGWCDVPLTKRGENEARSAGRLLSENGIEVDHAFTSVLRRASFTCNMCLNMAGQHWVPITKTWRLNERHYGALQGYNKDTAYDELGIDQELVMEMRRSYATAPPRMEDDHPYWHGRDRRYSKLSEEQLEKSRAESLKDAAERIMPFFNKVIVPSLREGNRCLVVSHANTIRTLIKQIDCISDEDIKQLSIPTGIPMIYRLDKDLKPVDPNCELEFRYLVQPKGYTWATSRQYGFHGVYLGDLERLQDIQEKRDATSRWWQRVILRNIAKNIIEEERCDHKSFYDAQHFSGDDILETKHVWYKLTKKMQNPEFSNMLLLVRMKEYLEGMLAYRRGKSNKNSRYIPLECYEKIVEKIHLDSAGEVVDPFVSLEDRQDREERQRRWIEGLSLDAESHSLIN
ncbi:hypothetical protein ACHAXN_002474 [Cyclotella atomus]